MTPITISAAQMQVVADAIFTYLESKTQRPILTIVEQLANKTVDAEIPALMTYLQSKGIITIAP